MKTTAGSIYVTADQQKIADDRLYYTAGDHLLAAGWMFYTADVKIHPAEGCNGAADSVYKGFGCNLKRIDNRAWCCENR